MTSDDGLSLPASVLAAVEEMLTGVDDQLRRDYPGEKPSRRPVHTVYVPAHRYHSGLGRTWGEQALAAMDAGGGMEALLHAADIAAELRPGVAERVHRKLRTEPIEDLRIDFEDGYGHRETEDDDVAAAARALRTDVETQAAPPFTGIRFKSLEAPTRMRGLRTLDLFLTALTAGGALPEGFVLTLAKVSAPAQVQAMVRVCEALEEARGLPSGRLGFEVQVETAPAILARDGTAGVAGLIRAGEGRVTGLHFGTYDYSAALGIAGAYQSMEHPAADHAKAVMQLAAAGTGVHISDGSTNILPVGEPGQVRQGWALHARLVRRSLERGFYQGWDLHPAQLPSRFAATYAFYREHTGDAAARLAAYLAGKQGQVADEPATARALARYLRRGLDCGALSATDLHHSGLDPAQLEDVLE